jgi:TadE-like protein
MVDTSKTMAWTARLRTAFRAIATGGRRRTDHSTKSVGAAAVELAICATLLVPLACLIIDEGYAWSRYQAVQTATRAGVRAGSISCLDEGSGTCTSGNRPDDDYRLLRAVRGSLRRTSFEQIQYVVVYRIAGNAIVAGDDGPPGLCDTGVAVAGVCNVYVRADFDRVATDFNCTTAPSNLWAPCTRNRTRAAADYLGIKIKVKHQNVIGIVSPDRSMSDVAVFRLEPQSFVLEKTKILIPPPEIVTTTTSTTLVPVATTTSTTIAAPVTTVDPLASTTLFIPTTVAFVTTTEAPTTTIEPTTTVGIPTTAGPVTTTITPATTTTAYVAPTTTTEPPIFSTSTTAYVAPTTVYVAPTTIPPSTTTTTRRPRGGF